MALGSVLPEEDDDVEIGTIVMWYGSAAAVPAGWQLCDGTNGTADMRSNFPLGATGDADGVPTNANYGTTGGDSVHSHDLEPDPQNPDNVVLGPGPDFPVSSDEKSNLPPFLSLHFIQRVS